jgi:ABC-2 type transport system ATP-binding protein
VRELIRELGQTRTILLSTHILPEASQVCTRVLIIHKGHIVAEDTPAGLSQRLQGAERLAVQVARPSPEIADALTAVPGVRAVQPAGDGRYEITVAPGMDVRAAVAEAVVRGGWGLLELRPVGMSLEEIFLQLTREEPVPQEEPYA